MYINNVPVLGWYKGSSIITSGYIGGSRLGLIYDLATYELIRAYPGLVSGVWDDRMPTLASWEDYTVWQVEGTWDDAAPTVTTDWAVPDGTPYATWDDTEVAV